MQKCSRVLRQVWRIEARIESTARNVDARVCACVYWRAKFVLERASVEVEGSIGRKTGSLRKGCNSRVVLIHDRSNMWFRALLYVIVQKSVVQDARSKKR